MPDENVIFTDEEMQQLILALLKGQGGRGAARGRVEQWLRWCEQAKIAGAIVDRTLSGEIVPLWGDQEEDWLFTAAKNEG
jgi:hypothetical protein